MLYCNTCMIHFMLCVCFSLNESKSIQRIMLVNLRCTLKGGFELKGESGTHIYPKGG